MREILVIKYSALGDFVMATGCFAAIRRQHQGDRITLLTTRPYAELGKATGWFDDVLIDTRPKLWHPMRWWALATTLRRRRFDRVYDLQRNQRTGILYRLMRSGRPGLEWSGVAEGCSHWVPRERTEPVHILRKLAKQLAVAGIEDVPPPDLSWLRGTIPEAVRPPFALLAAGAAPTRPEKLAPARIFVGVARWLLDRNVTPVLIGTAAEAHILARIAEECPAAVNLCGRTSLGDLAELGRAAAVAIGNDTGPMHVFSIAGCPTLALFSGASDPRRIAPCGSPSAVIQRADLESLTVDEVTAEIDKLMRRPQADVADGARHV